MEYLNGERTYPYADFWWDIENDFYIFFGEQKRNIILAMQEEALREQWIDNVKVGDWDKLSEYYSLVNQDLNDEAKEFLRPKKSKLLKRFVRTLNNKIEQDTNNH